MYLRQCLRRLALLRHHNLHLLRCRTLTQRFRNGHSALLSVFRNDRRLSLHHPWSRPFRLQVRMHCNRQWILSIQVLMLFAFSRPARWVPCSRLLHLMKRILSWLHLWPGVRNLSQQVMLRGDGSWHLLSGASWPQQPFDTCDSDTELSSLARILILVRPPVLCLLLLLRARENLPVHCLPCGSPQLSEIHLHPRGSPLARPSSMLACTHRAKSLHSHPVRTLQNARLRPVVHLKASVGNPVACPKPRPVPSARGAYASYPSLTTSWGKQAEGAVSKSSPPVKAQDGMDTSFPLQPAARISGLLPARRSGPLPSFQRPARVRATR